MTVTVAGVATPVDASGTFAVSAPLASEGNNQIDIVATDAAGNVATTSRTVDRDTQGPALAIVSPGQDTLTRAATVVIDGTASDRSGVTVTVNGATVTLENGAFAESRTLSEGSNGFTVVATDGAGNTTTATRLVASDRTPPALALLSPAPDTLTNAAAMTLRGRVYDATTMTLTVNGVPATIATDSTFSADVTLTGDGALSYPIVATDAAGNTSQVVATVQRDVTAPVVAIVSPAQGIVTKNEQASVSGTVSDAHTTRVSVNGVTMGVSNGTFAGAVPLDIEGVNTLTATATDAAGNSADAVATIMRDTQSPVITIDAPAGGTSTPNSSIVVRGHVGDASTVELAVNGTSTPVGADGSYSATVTLVRGTNPIGLHAVDAAGNAGDASVSVTRKTLEPGVPPDPATVAPPLDLTVTSVPSKVLEFLYTGTDPIQKGVAAGTIDKIRAAVIRGRVLQRVSGDTASEPLQGADVTILGHPELGTTKSREDGWYDMVVNGGGALTVAFAKPGYLRAERNVTVPWQSYTMADDVLLLRPDSIVTTIAMGAAQAQVARGSVATDEDGPRQATLIVPAGTQATMTLPNGTTQPLLSLSVRATEFTVGSSGAAAMPGVLPTTSSYTYAVQLSADEAIAAGVAPQDVVLSKPVPLYLENFLDIPVGTTVPVGAYDARLGQWVAQNNGRVIKILSTVGGIAQIDANGDGAADTDAQLAALGVDAAERAQVAITYQPGATLWRAPVLKLWPYDLNYGSTTAGIEPVAQINPGPLGAVRGPQCVTKNADPVACEIQVARQSIGVAGAPFTLEYTSARSRGAGERSLDITLTGPTIPADLHGVELAVSVAGQNFTKTFDPSPNLVYHFVWDGDDAYGRPVQGYQRVLIRIGHLYPVTYRAPAQQLQSFGLPCDAVPDKPGYCNLPADMKTRPRAFAPRSSWLTAMLGGWNAQPMGFGGFTPSILHTYDPIGRVLQMGDGTQRVADRIGAVVKTVAGRGGRVYSGDGGAALKAQLVSPAAVSVGPDGSIFIADKNNARVRKVLPDGSITTIAGTGNYDCCDSRSGIRALDANFGFVQFVIAMPDGGVLVANQNDYEIRRVWPDGTITVIAGLRFGGSTAEGIAATSASILVAGMARGPDGSIYIAGNGKIRRITPAGLIVTVAGNGGASPGQNEVPALQTAITNPQAITVGSDGTIYFFEFFGGVTNQDAIRKITPDGIVHLVEGRGTKNLVAGDRALDGSVRQFLAALAAGPDGTLYAADDFGVWRVTADGKYYPLTGNDASIGRGFQYPESPAIRTRMSGVAGLALGNTGEIYASISDSARVQRISAPLSGLALGETIIYSADGQTAYVLDEDGRHIQTRLRRGGAVVLGFSYDGNGRLNSVTDRDGNVTRIERDATGRPTAVLAPNGQRTGVTIGATGMLEAASPPGGGAVRFGFDAAGSLMSVTAQNGDSTTYVYEDGRVTQMREPGGGLTLVTRTPTPSGSNTSLVSPAGAQLALSIETLPDGSRRSVAALGGNSSAQVVTNADGSTTAKAPDGTVTTVWTSPDPRYGMEVPLLTATTVVSGINGATQTRTARQAAAITYDVTGNPIAEVDSTLLNGRVATSTFNYAEGTVLERAAGGGRHFARIDGNGHFLGDSVPGLLGTHYEYDPSGSLKQVVTGNGIWRFGYDGAGQLVERTSGSGLTTQFGYDAMGTVSRRISAKGDTLLFQHDSTGALTGVVPSGQAPHTRSYRTTLDGAVIELRAPSSGDSSTLRVATYDQSGRLVQVVRPGPDTLKYRYGSSGQLDTLTTLDGDYLFSHDSAGRVSQVVSPTGTVLNYQYLGQMRARMTLSGAVGGDVATAFNADFLPSGQTIAGSGNIALAYNTDLQLIGAGALTIERNNPDGEPTAFVVGAVRTSVTRDSVDRLSTLATGYNDAPLYSVDLYRDADARIVTRIETIQGERTVWGFGYDSASRLVSVTRDGVLAASYTYDANNNRTQVASASRDVSGVVDIQDRLLSEGAVGYGYTPRGERSYTVVGSDTTRYWYSALGILAKVKLPNGTLIDYVTDGEGRRVGKKLNGVLTQGWLYDGSLRIVAEVGASRTGSNNNIVSRFIFADKANVPEYMVRSGTTFRLVSDERGSIRLVVNVSTGAVVQRIDYDEFGRVTRNTNPGFQPFGFAGGLYDEATGLVRFGAREYDAESGRWMSKDPAGFAGGDANLYAYAKNNPVTLVDRSGAFATLIDATEAAEFRSQLAWSTFFGGALGCASGMAGQEFSNWLEEKQHVYAPDADLKVGKACIISGALGAAEGAFGAVLGRQVAGLGPFVKYQKYPAYCFYGTVTGIGDAVVSQGGVHAPGFDMKAVAASAIGGCAVAMLTSRLDLAGVERVKGLVSNPFYGALVGSLVGSMLTSATNSGLALTETADKR